MKNTKKNFEITGKKLLYSIYIQILYMYVYFFVVFLFCTSFTFFEHSIFSIYIFIYRFLYFSRILTKRSRINIANRRGGRDKFVD